MLNNFIYAKTKNLFLEELDAGNVLDEAIVFIEDTKEIWNHGTYFGNVSNIEVSSENLINTTYSELNSLRDNSQLIPGSFYRITDYVTTTTQSGTKSANHPFDVIVLALNENTLCEDAKAALHKGDAYFAYSDLNAWELKYCLDNDKTRFAWADETNGKGVIYRMIDEKQNDCPYDFKNIMFYNTKLISSNKYYYTFSYVVSDVLYDGTTEARLKHCYGNKIGGYHLSGALTLNKNVFRNSDFNDGCYSNTFGDNCYSNSFERNCCCNTFGEGCHNNNFRASLTNCSLDSNRTSITLSEEFYDDGSGQLVPIKHPDLSTQPSILPYKFMGQYVYELLIPLTIDNVNGLEKILNIPDLVTLMPDPLILESVEFVKGLVELNLGVLRDITYTKPVTIIYYYNHSPNNLTLRRQISENIANIQYAYLKIKYIKNTSECNNYDIYS